MATNKKSTVRTTPAKKATPVADKTEIMAPHQIVLSSNTQNAVGILAWSKFAGEADLQKLVNDLGEQTKKVQAGDMRPVEGMLYRQAKTLETMFTNLTRRAAGQENMKWFQSYLTLALKAQGQCRSTLEALAEIKNPRPVSFVKQANIANGPQQVNNGAATTHAKEIQNHKTELLEDQGHGSTQMDTRATRQRQSEAIRRWKPWKQSTGPQSLEGKAKASRNGWTGGHLAQIRQLTKELNQAMKAQRECLG